MEPVISASAGTGTITITGCTTSMGTALVCTILLEAFMVFTQAVSMGVAFMAAGGIAERKLNDSLCESNPGSIQSYSKFREGYGR
jgi:hypothetical protein